MFDGILSGADRLVAEAQEKLLNARKSMEKKLIRYWIAPRVYYHAEDRKRIAKENEKCSAKTLKSRNQTFMKELSTSAKGNWINAAKVSLKESTEILQMM